LVRNLEPVFWRAGITKRNLHRYFTGPAATFATSGQAGKFLAGREVNRLTVKGGNRCGGDRSLGSASILL